MGILDKVKDAATKATEQAKHGIAVGKEKVEETKLRKQMDETFESIGRLVVQQRRGEAPSDADAQIATAVAHIAELEQQIEAHTADAETAGDDGGATSAQA